MKMPMWAHIAVGMLVGQLSLKLTMLIGMFLAQ